MNREGSRPAVFLDRDGVLNQLVERDGKQVSPRRASDFRLFDEVDDAVRQLHQLGLEVFVVTNQPDIARRLMDAAELDAMHAQLQRVVNAREVAVCPHDDSDGCDCRKPLPGMIHRLAKRWNIDLSRSFLAGDLPRDVQAARAAGVRAILVDRSGRGGDADVVVDSLAAAVTHIESALSPSLR